MEKLLEYLVGPQVERIINSGAKRFKLHTDYTEVIDDEIGKGFKIPVNLNKISESPELHAGDLLLIRGDVIHKTQDSLTHRVAISIRSIDGTSPICLQTLKSGCEEKIKYIERNQHYYDKIFIITNKKPSIIRNFYTQENKINIHYHHYYKKKLNNKSLIYQWEIMEVITMLIHL